LTSRLSAILSMFGVSIRQSAAGERRAHLVVEHRSKVARSIRSRADPAALIVAYLVGDRTRGASA
jgi:hypothetical protein